MSDDHHHDEAPPYDEDEGPLSVGRQLSCPGCGAPAGPGPARWRQCTYCYASFRVSSSREADSVDEEDDEEHLEWPQGVKRRLLGRPAQAKLKVVREALNEALRHDRNDEIFALTMGLQHIALQLRPPRLEREALETALARLPSVHHRALQAQLALGAACTGELALAEACFRDLAADDLTADDSLLVDSLTRLARARIALWQEQMSVALDQLGVSYKARPVHPAYFAFACLLRAEALERSGRWKEAASERGRVVSDYGSSTMRSLRRAYGLIFETRTPARVFRRVLDVCVLWAIGGLIAALPTGAVVCGTGLWTSSGLPGVGAVYVLFFAALALWFNVTERRNRGGLRWRPFGYE